MAEPDLSFPLALDLPELSSEQGLGHLADIQIQVTKITTPANSIALCESVETGLFFFFCCYRINVERSQFLSVPRRRTGSSSAVPSTAGARKSSQVYASASTVGMASDGNCDACAVLEGGAGAGRRRRGGGGGGRGGEEALLEFQWFLTARRLCQRPPARSSEGAARVDRSKRCLHAWHPEINRRIGELEEDSVAPELGVDRGTHDEAAVADVGAVKGSTHGAASKSAVFMQHGVSRHPATARAPRLRRETSNSVPARGQGTAMPAAYAVAWSGPVDAPVAQALVRPRSISIACGRQRRRGSGLGAQRGVGLAMFR